MCSVIFSLGLLAISCCAAAYSSPPSVRACRLASSTTLGASRCCGVCALSQSQELAPEPARVALGPAPAGCGLAPVVRGKEGAAPGCRPRKNSLASGEDVMIGLSFRTSLPFLAGWSCLCYVAHARAYATLTPTKPRTPLSFRGQRRHLKTISIRATPAQGTLTITGTAVLTLNGQSPHPLQHRLMLLGDMH